MSLFDEMLKTKHYQDLIDKLSDDEKEAILKALREFVESFENTIIKPIENYNPK